MTRQELARNVVEKTLGLRTVSTGKFPQGVAAQKIGQSRRQKSLDLGLALLKNAET